MGQTVNIEGPYGCFNFDRRNRKSHQIWIAGGIGITPFLARLEALSSATDATVPEADLHYCTRNAGGDPMVDRLRALCDGFPGIHLEIHDSSKGQRLSAETLSTNGRSAAGAEVWFCGPAGLGKPLETACGQHPSA